jgi:hypothetical protein
MSSFTRIFLRVLLVASAGLLAACSINSQKDSSIPWNKPADWEGQIPGMGMNNTH